MGRTFFFLSLLLTKNFKMVFLDNEPFAKFILMNGCDLASFLYQLFFLFHADFICTHKNILVCKVAFNLWHRLMFAFLCKSKWLSIKENSNTETNTGTVYSIHCIPFSSNESHHLQKNNLTFERNNNPKCKKYTIYINFQKSNGNFQNQMAIRLL